jgi:hypothetical protein
MNTGCHAFKQALDTMGFFSRTHETTPIIGAYVVDGAISDKIFDPSAWYISFADADIELALFDQLTENALQYAKNAL